MKYSTKNLIGTLVLAGLIAAASLVLPTACVPDAQAEAEAVAASVQDAQADAQTAAMQEAIDRVCGHLDIRTQLACAVDVLSELQPDRWTPEDAERAHEAAEYITKHPTN